MRTRITVPILLLLALAMFALPVEAQTPPAVPAARFYGSVTIGGYAAPAGASLTVQGANGTYCGSGQIYSDGSYTIDVQPASSCLGPLTFFVNGQPADQPGYLTNTLSGAVALNLSVSSPYYGAYGPPLPPYSGISGSVTYQAGWNLVAGPPGSLMPPAAGSLFTWQPGDASYETISTSTSMQAGYGYWTYFSSTTTVTLSTSSLHRVQRRLAPGQRALVGNPFNQPATISGASSAYSYDPQHGYQQTTVLQPGQGAWVVSTNGMVVISGG